MLNGVLEPAAKNLHWMFDGKGEQALDTYLEVRNRCRQESWGPSFGATFSRSYGWVIGERTGGAQTATGEATAGVAAADCLLEFYSYARLKGSRLPDLRGVIREPFGPVMEDFAESAKSAGVTMVPQVRRRPRTHVLGVTGGWLPNRLMAEVLLENYLVKKDSASGHFRFQFGIRHGDGSLSVATLGDVRSAREHGLKEGTWVIYRGHEDRSPVADDSKNVWEPKESEGSPRGKWRWKKDYLLAILTTVVLGKDPCRTLIVGGAHASATAVSPYPFMVSDDARLFESIHRYRTFARETSWQAVLEIGFEDGTLPDRPPSIRRIESMRVVAAEPFPQTCLGGKPVRFDFSR